MEHLIINSKTHNIKIANFSPTIWNIYHLALSFNIPIKSFKNTQNGILLKTAEKTLIDKILFPNPEKLLGIIKSLIEPIKDKSQWSEVSTYKKRPPTSREDVVRTLNTYVPEQIERVENFMKRYNLSLETFLNLENKIKEIRDKYNKELEYGILNNIKQELKPIQEKLEYYESLWNNMYSPEEYVSPETGEEIPRNILLQKGPGQISQEQYDWEMKNFGPNITKDEIKQR